MKRNNKSENELQKILNRRSSHLEEWEALLDDFLLSYKNFDFLLKWYYVMIVVEHHPENMPEFNAGYPLSDKVLTGTI